MSELHIDQRAKIIVVREFGLPPCLHIPIGARDALAIEKYIGIISRDLVPGKPGAAFLIESPMPDLDLRLPIWRIPESAILHAPRQVWVDVDFRGYRKVFSSAFPDRDYSQLVLDHVLNRRVARLKGFGYVRIVPISRAANSSSGGLAERWSVEYHSTARMRRINQENPAFIQYADIADIVKMLDLKTGGALQDGVNECLWLTKPIQHGQNSPVG